MQLVQRRRISISPFADKFEHIFISEEIGYPKPCPGIFEYALKTAGLSDKSKILMIGDNYNSDIKGGINFGIDTCWLNADNKLVEDQHPTYQINNIKELPDILF